MPSHTFIATWLGRHRGRRATGAGRARDALLHHRRRRRRGGDQRRARRRSCPSTSTASRPTCRRLARARRAPLRWRSSRTPPRRTAHGVGGQPVGACGDAAAWSLLPGQEPRRARRRRRRHDRRRRSLAARLRRLRNYGSERKYVNLEQGANSRLDELQAAILGGAARPARRRGTSAAARVAAQLRCAASPARGSSCRRRRPAGHAWHLYVVRHAARATRWPRTSRAAGVGTLVHYPIPLPPPGRLRRRRRRRRVACPIADRLAARCCRCRSGRISRPSRRRPGRCEVVRSAAHTQAA